MKGGNCQNLCIINLHYIDLCWNIQNLYCTLDMLVLVCKLIFNKDDSNVEPNSLNEKFNSWFLFTFRQDQQVPHVPAVYQVLLPVVLLVIWYIMINLVPQKWEWEDPLVTVVILTRSKTVHSRSIFQNITRQSLLILDEQVCT